MIDRKATLGELLGELSDRGVTHVTLVLRHVETLATGEETFGRVRLAGHPRTGSEFAEVVIEVGRTGPSRDGDPTPAIASLARALRLFPLTEETRR